MTRIPSAYSPAGMALILALIAILAPGCRESSESLSIQPSFVELYPGSNTVNFVVTGNSTGETFATPLDWSVTDPQLGTVLGSSGFTAIYVANDALGINIITARDNLNNEGYATVRQVDAAGSIPESDSTPDTDTGTELPPPAE